MKAEAEETLTRRVVDSAIHILSLVGLVYVGLCLVVLFRQSAYVYYPEKGVALTPGYFDIAFEDLKLTTQDGETLGAWFVQASTNDGATRTILFCHGNAGNLGDRLDSIRTFRGMGYHVLAFDYRGYGDSTGKPTENGTYEDAMTAWRYLTETRGIDARRIVVFGRSLGGAVATWLATQVDPLALIVESSFTSAPDMAAKMFWYLPVRALCRFRYDNLARMSSLRCPVLVAHGREDKMIPFSHGQRLYEAAPEPKRFVEIQGGHNDGGLDANPHYQEILKGFIKEAP
jgi:fermentation-respiration switch protein FrsA (DUF1100 family)